MNASRFFRLVLFLALLVILDETAGAQEWSLSGNAGTNPATNFLGTTDNIPLIFRTNNAERMRIEASGDTRFRLSTNNNLRVGIAFRPDVLVRDDFALDLTKNLDTTPSARILFDGFPDANTHRASLGFFTRGASDTGILERMRISETGNVGIGTAGPAAKLEVSGIGTTGPGNNDVRITGTGTVGAGIEFNATGPGGRRYAILSTARDAGPGPGKLGFLDVAAGRYWLVTDQPTGSLQLFHPNGSKHIELVANQSSLTGHTNSGGGLINVTDGGGRTTIQLMGDTGNGTGKVVTSVLQITGGSDLAELFEVSGAEAIEPGMVVAIDPKQSGHLRLADKAYDRTVAGIVSGANGINPGLTMKQEGTVADGSLPVSLTGRVYCWANAANGPIQPGDLLTTSDTPGHAMKVIDHAKALGAIIGKAMTELKQGKGMVLVLVTLQ